MCPIFGQIPASDEYIFLLDQSLVTKLSKDQSYLELPHDIHPCTVPTPVDVAVLECTGPAQRRTSRTPK